MNTIASEINRDFVEKNFEDLFKGLGKFEVPYKILLKENAIPKANAPRRVPLAIKKKLKDKLDSLEKNKIIEKTTGYSEWVNNLVTVEKKDKEKSLRICIDPAALNESIIDEHFLLPTFEELSVDLYDAKYFSVLDLKDGFWHIELEQESRDLCTFATPFGNYKFLRLPFGIKTAPQVFQKMNFAIFGDIKNVSIYMDDILIRGKTREEHDEALLAVLNRAREKNVKFNINKLKIAVTEVRYLGHIFSENKITPDPERIKSIRVMKHPANKKDLQTYLGVINYMRSFIPNLSELTASFRDLLKKNVIFTWTQKHTEIFEQIKTLIVNSPLLVPFDERKEIKIQCDASQNGLGCCLLQDNKPIAFASRSLTDSEKHYSQIEKEFLSILFSCRKFSFFTYGRTITVVNDHKPLLGIMKKEIHKIPSSKLQKIRLKLLNFDIRLQYASGKTIHIADYLSRYTNETDMTDEDKTITDSVLSIHASEDKINEFILETGKDVILKRIKDYCLKGWPENRTKCPEELRYFYKIKDDIMIENGILFYGERIIVPSSMRDKILIQIHEPHFGIVKTKKRAKNSIYWPGIDSDIENIIAKCSVCLKYAHRNQNEPLVCHEIPERPFEKIGCDVLEFKGKNYLVIVDYYSKWIELKQLRRKQAKDINEKLLEAFSQFGIPLTVIADNMPFGSLECREFAKEFDFKFETSSPYHPRSNGLAERSVQICKNILKKTKNEHEVQNALLEYRLTPTKDLEYSPSQLLQNRILRSKLPTHENKLVPRICTNANNQMKQKQENMRHYYNKTAKEREEFKLNEKVMIWLSGEWHPGEIVKIWHTPRSYVVQTDEGLYRRNSKDLRKLMVREVHNNNDEELALDKRTRSGKRY